MARTVYGAHKRYMDTYLNVYKGYYVRSEPWGIIHAANINRSLLAMAQAVITKASTGSAAALTTS